MSMPRPSLYPVKKIIGFDDPLIAAIDEWRRGRQPIPSMSEAIRQILRKHLRQKGYMPKKSESREAAKTP
jgi:hypothetical protein